MTNRMLVFIGNKDKHKHF